MREILFKGKRKDNGEWVEGDLVNNYDEKKFIGEIIINKSKSSTADKYDVGISLYEVIPETIGQYTGLTDKNGVKIFEGNIVQSEEYDFKGVVVFDEYCRFVIKSLIEGCTYLLAHNNDDVEIIGNIHDNPELLEVGENG